MQEDEVMEKYAVGLGQPCYARYTDNFYYYGVLLEVKGMYCNIHFLANQDEFLNKSKSPKNVKLWVPLNDICNLYWGLLNLTAYGYQKKKAGHFSCEIRNIQQNGRVEVEFSNSGVVENLPFYNMCFSGRVQPMYPAAPAIYASVNGTSVDIEAVTRESRDALMKKLNDVLGVQGDKTFTLYGRQITIPGAVIRCLKIETSTAFYRELCDQYLETYSGYIDMEEPLKKYKRDLSHTLKPMIKDFVKIFEQASMAISEERFIRLYADSKAYAEFYNIVVRHFNELADMRNEIVSKWNSRQNSRRSSSTFSNMLNSMRASQIDHDTDPNTIYKNEEIRLALLAGVVATMNDYMREFVNCINDYIGETYILYEVDESKSNTFLGHHCLLEYEEKRDFKNIDYIFNSLITNPWNKGAYLELVEFFGVNNSGLEEFIGFFYKGADVYKSIRLAVADKYLRALEFYPEAAYLKNRTFFSDFTREELGLSYTDLLPVSITLDAIDIGYDIHRVLQQGLCEEWDCDSTQESKLKLLSEKWNKAFTDLENTNYTVSNAFFRNALFKLRQPGWALIAERACTAEGMVFATPEQAEIVRAQAKPLIQLFKNTNFSIDESVCNLTNALNLNNNLPTANMIRHKAERAVQLSKEIDAFISQVWGKAYSARIEWVYDMVRGKILDCERKLLGMGRLDVADWYSNQLQAACSVYGQTFDTIAHADTHYYTVLGKAWEHHRYLEEKKQPQQGFLKSLFKSSLQPHESEYWIATNNGQHYLAPLQENEHQSVVNYWKYLEEECTRLKQWYTTTYTQNVNGAQNTDTILKEIQAVMNHETIQKLLENALDADFE